MKPILPLALAMLMAGPVFAADVATNSRAKESVPAPVDPVKEAVLEFKEAPNYSWTTAIDLPGSPFAPGSVKGKTEKSGLTFMSQSMNENTMEVATKANKAAMKTDGGWKLLAEVEGFPAMMAGFMVRTGAAAQEAEDLLKKAKELKPGEGGLLSADLTDEGAKALLTFGPRDGQNGPPPPKNAKGSVKFWLKEGALVKFESHLTALMTFGQDQEEHDFEVRRTTEIKDLGATKLDVPEAALKKLE